MRHPTRFWSSLLFLFFLSVSWGQRSNTDNKRPICDHCNQQLSCNCSYGGFTSVPTVTGSALSLDLSFNSITVVMDNDLMGHMPLKALDLHGNGLAEIHPSAFDSLRNLEQLDLSDNQLTALNYKWFSKLEALQQLNLLNNPYSYLGSPPVFGALIRLRKLAFGGPALKELRSGDLSGVTQLDELTVHANNLARYDAGTLANIWPLGCVTLALHGPFSTNVPLAGAMIHDVSYPETPITVKDIHLIGIQSVQPFREAANRRIRHLTVYNISVSDEAIVDFLMIFDGAPLTQFIIDDVTLTGEGRLERANMTDHKSIDEFYIRNLVVLDVYKFTSLIQLGFLLEYPRRVSVINSKVFVMPCITSHLLKNLQYLDLSDNLLTDLTLVETLCGTIETLKDIRVLNFSGNALKSLSTVSRLVTKFSKLTHLDISRTGYSFMPSTCPWPSSLRFLNISGAKITTITPCLPKTLEVLDLSNNNLYDFTLLLPLLRELHLSGNKFLRLPSGMSFPNLQTLTIKANTLNVFGKSDLQSYQQLENIQAGQNKFVCSCDFVSFLQMELNGVGSVQLTDGADSYICDSPLYLQGQQVDQVRLSVVMCHQVLFVSVSCGLALFIAVLLSVVLWHIHAFWYLKMIWAWVKAKRNSRRRQQRRDVADTEALISEAQISFDAFVSYSERDASWVENFLVPELEEPGETNTGASSTSHQPLTLCLHKRDFLPGQWIVDNIMSAIERSRRTVFILSENFVHSDWCRYELDFSHFWLFDGPAGSEAAILILLEPLSKNDVPKRFYKLRKLMSSTTYLEWPQEEEKREAFWRSLRTALRREDD